MGDNLPGSVVTGFEGLTEAIELPDKDDRHVVVAANEARAKAIITFNLKDVLSVCSANLLHPDEFISHLLGLNMGALLKVFPNSVQGGRADGYRPVMAEGFGARSYSSEVTCLQEAAQSDPWS